MNNQNLCHTYLLRFAFYKLTISYSNYLMHVNLIAFIYNRFNRFAKNNEIT